MKRPRLKLRFFGAIKHVPTYARRSLDRDMHSSNPLKGETMIGFLRVAARGVSALAIAGALFLRTQAPAVADSSELDVLNKIPHVVLDHLASDATPDAQGAMQLNVGGWHSVVYQRVAIPLIWIGAVESSAAKVDDGWRAVDLAFAHQKADGSFETADGTPTRPTDMSFWLGAVSHAMLVLQESSLGDRYKSKVAALKPKIAKATAWLEQPANRAALLHGDYRDDKFFASNRLLIDACAFLTSSRLTGDPAPLVYARQFLAQAVDRETPDGVFPENGGFDSSYQTVSLLNGTYYALRDPSAPGLRDALSKALAYEVGAVDLATGTLDVSRNTRTAGQEKIFGHVKKPDYRSVILGLYYAGAYLDNSAATNAAERVFSNTYHIEATS